MKTCIKCLQHLPQKKQKFENSSLIFSSKILFVTKHNFQQNIMKLIDRCSKSTKLVLKNCFIFKLNETPQFLFFDVEPFTPQKIQCTMRLIHKHMKQSLRKNKRNLNNHTRQLTPQVVVEALCPVIPQFSQIQSLS